MLLGTGLVALLFYSFGGRKDVRTPIPLALAVIALGAQIVGLIVEFGDSEARGDDFGGTLYYVPLLVLAAWHYFRPLAIGPAGAPRSDMGR